MQDKPKKSTVAIAIITLIILIGGTIGVFWKEDTSPSTTHDWRVLSYEYYETHDTNQSAWCVLLPLINPETQENVAHCKDTLPQFDEHVELVVGDTIHYIILTPNITINVTYATTNDTG